MTTKNTVLPRMTSPLSLSLVCSPVFVAARRSMSGTISAMTHASSANQLVGGRGVGGFAAGGVEVAASYAANVPAATTNLDYAWDITADAPKFQAKACIKRPQSFSGPPD